MTNTRILGIKNVALNQEKSKLSNNHSVIKVIARYLFMAFWPVAKMNALKENNEGRKDKFYFFSLS